MKADGRHLCEELQLNPGTGRNFWAREDHVMAVLGGQEACARDLFRNLV